MLDGPSRLRWVALWSRAVSETFARNEKIAERILALPLRILTMKLTFVSVVSRRVRKDLNGGLIDVARLTRDLFNLHALYVV